VYSADHHESSIVCRQPLTEQRLLASGESKARFSDSGVMFDGDVFAEVDVEFQKEQFNCAPQSMASGNATIEQC